MLVLHGHYVSTKDVKRGQVHRHLMILLAMLLLAQARKLVFTTVDRAVSYYEANRGLYELTGRVYASGNMGVPQALTLVQNDTGIASK
jgi:hypothetical protein